VVLQAVEGYGSYTATSDLTGTFTVHDVRPGQYYVVGMLSGYLSILDTIPAAVLEGDLEAAKENIGKFAGTVTVEAKGVSVAEIELVRGGSLAGTIRYDDGSPAILAGVKLKQRVKDGPWTNSVLGSARPSSGPLMTDDRGRFRIVGLPPGEYTLEVTLPVMSMGPQTLFGRQFGSSTALPRSVMTVFYGDVVGQSGAKAISLGMGEEREGVDIVIPTAGMRLVEGTVMGKGEGVAVTKGRVELVATDVKTVLQEQELGIQGRFRFEAVPEGSYVLRVVGAEGADGKGFAGYSEAIVVKNDLRDMVIELGR